MPKIGENQPIIDKAIVHDDIYDMNPSALTNHLKQPIGEPINNWVDPKHAGVPVLAGKHIRLERLAPTHSADLYQAFSEESDDSTWTYLPYGPFDDLADFQQWLIPFSFNLLRHYKL